MDEIIELLTGPLGVLVGVIVGAALAVVGSAIIARASRQAARETADASIAVATAQRSSERRIRMDELTYMDRRSLVDELLRILGEQELETLSISEATWDPDRAVMRHRPEGAAVVSRMRAVFPGVVTEAASSAVSASVAAAQAHSNVDRHRDADRKVRQQTELHRLDALLAYERVRDEFLEEVQKVMTRLDDGAM